MKAERRFPPRSAFGAPDGPDPHRFADFGFSIHPDQGEFIYLPCRGLGAKRVADFATSVSMSALSFAAAMRDNCGGQCIGPEFVLARVKVARKNLADAGLATDADIREGDARETMGRPGRANRFRADRWRAGFGRIIAGALGDRNRRAAAAHGRPRTEQQCRAGLPRVHPRPGQRFHFNHHWGST